MYRNISKKLVVISMIQGCATAQHQNSMIDPCNYIHKMGMLQ